MRKGEREGHETRHDRERSNGEDRGQGAAGDAYCGEDMDAIVEEARRMRAVRSPSEPIAVNRE